MAIPDHPFTFGLNDFATPILIGTVVPSLYVNNVTCSPVIDMHLENRGHRPGPLSLLLVLRDSLAP